MIIRVKQTNTEDDAEHTEEATKLVVVLVSVEDAEMLVSTNTV